MGERERADRADERADRASARADRAEAALCTESKRAGDAEASASAVTSRCQELEERVAAVKNAWLASQEELKKACQTRERAFESRMAEVSRLSRLVAERSPGSSPQASPRPPATLGGTPLRPALGGMGTPPNVSPPGLHDGNSMSNSMSPRPPLGGATGAAGSPLSGLLGGGEAARSPATPARRLHRSPVRELGRGEPDELPEYSASPVLGRGAVLPPIGAGGSPFAQRVAEAREEMVREEAAKEEGRREVQQSASMWGRWTGSGGASVSSSRAEVVSDSDAEPAAEPEIEKEIEKEGESEATTTAAAAAAAAGGGFGAGAGANGRGGTEREADVGSSKTSEQR